MISNFCFKDKYSCDDLIEIVSILRSPNGCPWDIEQTHESIKKDFIEETYEVIEAINKNSKEMLREELGDVLLQVVFHTCIETEKGSFNFTDVCDEICKKLILRHPHVFGDVNVNSTQEVLANWDEIKMKSKKQNTITEAMDSVPKELPALMRAEKIQKKAAKVGFDWDEKDGALQKIEEELFEVREAFAEKEVNHLEEEIGDLLFAVVNASRFARVNPEEALTKATDKFIKRFSLVEQFAKEKDIDMKNASLEELDALWDDAKQVLKEQSL